MLILIVVLILLFSGGGYWAGPGWGYSAGFPLAGLLLVVLVLMLLRGGRLGL